MFPATSRYSGIAILHLQTADGRTLPYLSRRFLPPAAAAITMAEHVVTQDERLDNITARYLGDPEQFWRVCDANSAMLPEELTDEAALGRRLRIPLPQGG